MIARLAAEASPVALGATSLAEVLWRRLRISRAEARRRIAEAADLGPRTGDDRRGIGAAVAGDGGRSGARGDRARTRGDHPAVLRAAAGLGGPSDPRAGRSHFGPDRGGAGSRGVAAGRRPAAGAAAPGRRAAHRRRAGPAALPHRGPAGRRRDERNPGPAGPRSPRHPGCGAGQVGRPGHVQPRRRNPVCGRPTQRGGRAGRPALPAAAQPRRAESHGAQRCWPRDSWVSTTGYR